MIDFLSKKFIKDYDNYQKVEVRGRYGILCSVLSIVLNLIMAVFKIALGVMTNSVAILATGFDTLADVASNTASLFGFMMALKNPDKEHPFGHGRMEYLASLVIAFLILFVGTQLLWDSVYHVIHPEEIHFSLLSIFVLLISIVIKLWMWRINSVVGKRIDSGTLMAASKDSLSDVIARIVTLIVVIASLYLDFPIDGIFGAVVSLIILKTGYDIAKETVTSLLGAPPDEKLLEELKVFTSSYDRVIGTHDLMIHDYGPGRRYLTMHVEVNKNEEMMAIHEVIDNIERDIYATFNIQATIHLDPVDLDDQLTRKMKSVATRIVTEMNVNYSIHDFRVRRYAGDTTLIFDVTIPAEDTMSHHELMAQIDTKIKHYDPDFNTLIQIDHSYT